MTISSDEKRRWAFAVEIPKYTVNLPLPPINWSRPVLLEELADGKAWPPASQTDRLARLNTLWKLWYGDLSAVVTPPPQKAGPLPPAINLIEPIVATVTDLLTADPPEITPSLDGGPALEDLWDTVSETVMDTLRYGAGWVWAGIRRPTQDPDTEDSDPDPMAGLFVESPDPANVFRVEDGRRIITETADDGKSITFNYINLDNATMETVVRPLTASKTLGEPDEERSSEGHVAYLTRADGRPRIPAWGTPYTQPLWVPAVLMNVRSWGVDDVLDAHGHPLLAAWRDHEVPVDGFSDLQTVDVQRDGDIESETQDIADLRGHSYIELPSGINRLEYITWDGNLNDGREQITRYTELVWQLSGLPSILIETGGVPSGIAVQRLLARLNLKSKQLLASVKFAVDTALSVVMATKVSVDWQTGFDILDAGDPGPAFGAGGFFAGPMPDET